MEGLRVSAHVSKKEGEGAEKMTTRQISRDIAKWSAEQRRKKVIVLYLYVPAMILLLSTALLRVFCPPLLPIPLVLGILMLVIVIWYSYNAFWKDRTGNALLRRLEGVKKALVEKRRKLEKRKEVRGK